MKNTLQQCFEKRGSHLCAVRARVNLPACCYTDCDITTKDTMYTSYTDTVYMYSITDFCL